MRFPSRRLHSRKASRSRCEGTGPGLSYRRPIPAAAVWCEAFAFFCRFQYCETMEENEVIKSLAALAQPCRLGVFRALVVVGEEGLTPGTMSEALGIPA